LYPVKKKKRRVVLSGLLDRDAWQNLMVYLVNYHQFDDVSCDIKDTIDREFMLENEHGIIKYIWSKKFSDNWIKDNFFLKENIIN